MSFNPAAFFVRRWQFTLVAFALMVLLGLNALNSISRSEDPQFPFPVVVVRAVLPGATPEEVEQLVAKPIEDVLGGLDDIKDVESTSFDGGAVVSVEFNWGVEPDRKYDEVVREINALRPTLPQGLAVLEARKIGTNQVAFFQVALVSDVLPMRRLEKLAHSLRDKVNAVPGVKLAKYWGAPSSQVQVAVDMAKLAQLRLSPTSVSDALRGAGAEAPIGAIHAADRRFNVKSGGAFKSLEEVGGVNVATLGGAEATVETHVSGGVVANSICCRSIHPGFSYGFVFVSSFRGFCCTPFSILFSNFLLFLDCVCRYSRIFRFFWTLTSSHG
jgi:multidrug efflux pump subunit AcrB